MMRGAFPVLLISSIKAYSRNRVAIFFSLLVPLFIMVIFGLLNLGGNVNEHIGIVDQAHNAASQQMIDGFKQIKVFTLYYGDEKGEKAALHNGDRALVVVLPKTLGAPNVPIPVYANLANPQATEVSRAIVQQFLDNASFAKAKIKPAFSMDFQGVTGRSATYVDFLVPGIIALSIMQTGIFSVAFAFVQQKQTGVLRRLMATPMKISDFLAAQITTRLIMAAVQVVILLLVGILFFKFHLNGNFVELLIAAALGSAIFIAIGFAISGFAKDEQAVPAIANVIVLPMMFLSGVFFPRDYIPTWLKGITDLLPLTYVSNALRAIAVDGASLWGVRENLLGVLVWLAISTFVAVRLFRWEV